MSNLGRTANGRLHAFYSAKLSDAESALAKLMGEEAPTDEHQAQLRRKMITRLKNQIVMLHGKVTLRTD